MEVRNPNKSRSSTAGEVSHEVVWSRPVVELRFSSLVLIDDETVLCRCRLLFLLPLVPELCFRRAEHYLGFDSLVREEGKLKIFTKHKPGSSSFSDPLRPSLPLPPHPRALHVRGGSMAFEYLMAREHICC